MKKLQFVFSIFCVVMPVASFALSATDPGVVPMQSISDHRWRDANTGRFIEPPNSTPASTPAPTTTQAPAATSTPKTTTTKTSTPAPGSTPKKVTAKTAGGAALGALGLVTGTMGVVDSASGNTQHSWGDVVEGSVSGAVAAAGATAVINAIPVFGQIGYGITVASGAIIGGMVAGSQLFSETDCLNDPVTGKYTCCNTAFNKGERQVDIGGYMFCTNDGETLIAPGIRQCQQGGQGEKQGSVFSQLWQDDAWASECVAKFCDENDKPVSGIDEFIVWEPDTENFCWNWDCITGYTKESNTCVSNGGSVRSKSDYDIIIQKIEALRQQIISKCGLTE